MADVPHHIRYPQDHVLGIVDDHDEAEAALQALEELGVAHDDITVLTGEEGAARIDASGARHGLLGRLWRTVQFVFMDALPDAGTYEEAAGEGRYVIAVRVHGEKHRDDVSGILKNHHGHFINYYGKLATQPLAP